MTVLRLLERKLERFFPFHCQICGQRTEQSQEMCDVCRLKMPWLLNGCRVCARPLSAAADQICGHCLQAAPDYQRAIVMFRYETEVKQFISKMKFRRHTASIRLMSDMLAEHVQHSGLPLSTVMPVPLHPKRIRQRGYNQSAELAKGVADKLGWPLDLVSLFKHRHTLPQVGLSGSLRKRNLKGAFGVAGDLQGRNVLLVDDVMTTDSTTNECAKALHKTGVGEVYVAAVARTLK